MKHSVKYKYFQDAITNQEVWLRKVGTEHNVADGLTKALNQQVLGNMFTTLKIELLESTHQHVSVNLIVATSVQNGCQSKCWAQEHRERLPRNFEEYHEGLPRNFEGHRESLPRSFEGHRGRLTRERAEVCVGLPGKV